MTINQEVILQVGHVFAKVKKSSFEIDRIIDNLLSIDAPWKWFTSSFRNRLWDGKIKFYDSKNKKFLSGFSYKVKKALEESGYSVKINGPTSLSRDIDISDVNLVGIDQERWNKIQFPLLKEMVKRGRCCLRLATGGGKTEIIAGLCQVYKQEKVLVLVHRIELLQQTIQRLQYRTGEKVGSISATGIDTDARIVVGMIQSIWSKRQQIAAYLKDQVGVLVLDECHHGSAKTWVKICMICKAKYRFGLSGTPFKGNEEKDLSLIGVTGPLVEGLSISKLVDMGYAVKPIVRIMVPKLSWDFPDNIKWHQVVDEVYSNASLYDVVDKILKFHNQGSVIIFVDRIKICKNLSAFLKLRGYNVDISLGALLDEERLNILNKFRKKEIDVLITTTVLDEGVDIPSVQGIIFLCSNKSIVKILQRIGRGVRQDKDKDNIYVYDIAIKVKWLYKQLKTRLKIYSQEKITTEIYNLEEDQWIKV